MEDLFQCRVCKTTKPRSEFSKTNTNVVGIETRCKACRREYYRLNSDKIKSRIKQHTESNKEIIRNRRSARYQEKKAEIRAKEREKRNNNITRRLEKETNYRTSCKVRAYEVLGNICKACGESDKDLLCVDHINNDGSDERRQGISRIKIFNEIIKGSVRYQLLCFNCNQKKQVQFLTTRSALEQGVLKTCSTCRVDKDKSYFKSDKKYPDGSYYECFHCTNNRHNVLKIQAFNKLGQVSCLKCGCTDCDILSIDHKNENGYALRRKEGTGALLYNNIIYNRIDTQNLQVLCFNCNLKKSKYVKRNGNKTSHGDEDPVESHELNEEKCFISSFELTDLVFKPISDIQQSVTLMEKYHYAGFGRYGCVNYGAYLDDKLIAVAKLSSPVRLEVAKSLKLEYSEVLELDRFCIDPAYQKKNLASYFLSRLVKHIRNTKKDITHLVSFADPSHGHLGVIYKAANWKKVKLVARSYEYRDNNGKSYHKKTIYNQARQVGLKELEYSISIGLTRSYTLRKIKYLYKL